MVPEAPLVHSEEGGLVLGGDGWFVLNAQEARWRDRPGRGKSLPFEGPMEFPQTAIVLYVLGPGEPIGMYHWEVDQEDFLVLHGTALLLIEGEERPLRQWDFVHCPPGAAHMIIGGEVTGCAVLALGARERSRTEEWGRYAVDAVAERHGVGVARETSDADEAYERFAEPTPAPYGGWLAG